MTVKNDSSSSSRKIAAIDQFMPVYEVLQANILAEMKSSALNFPADAIEYMRKVYASSRIMTSFQPYFNDVTDLIAFG
jgi:hypothetical protein